MSRTKSVLSSAIKAGRVPGLVAIATSGDSLLHYSAHGRRSILDRHRMTMNTMFRSPSLLKPLMAVAALQLVETGALDLDDRASGVPAHSVRLPGTVPSMRQLLCRLANPKMFTDQASMIWARLAIEQASGRTIGEYLQKSILKPLGMHDSHFSLPISARDRLADVHRAAADNAVTTVSLSTLESSPSRYGHPTFYSTAPDSVKLLRALLSRDPNLLSPKAHHELQRSRGSTGHTEKVLTYHDFLSTHCWINWQAGTAGALFTQWLDREKRPLTPLFDSFQQEVHTEPTPRLHRFFELINPYRDGVYWY